MRRLLPLVLFTVAYMAAFTGMAFAAGNGEFLFYAAVTLIIMGAVMAIHRRAQFSLPVLWGLSIWGLLHVAGGNVPIPPSLAPDWSPTPRHDGSVPVRTVLYNLRPAEWLPKFDQVVHVYGFFVATLASYQFIRRASLSHAALAAVAVLMGMGLGALNEVVEFTATRVMTTNVGGYVNTGWDLVSNLIGAAAAGGLIAARGRRDR